jgi:hypothetical protein
MASPPMLAGAGIAVGVEHPGLVLEIPARPSPLPPGPPHFRAGPAARSADLRIALEDLEAGVDQVDAVEEGLQLGRLVDHMHGRRDLAAVVQQAGDLQFVAIAVVM